MSQETRTTIKDFTDLDTWKQGHLLVLGVYALCKAFPDDERYDLIRQLRRAAVSVTSNIAEGFSRQTSNDRAHFYTMARGSLTEVQNQLLIARDVSYLDTEEYQAISNQAVRVHKLLTGLIRATKGANRDS